MGLGLQLGCAISKVELLAFLRYSVSYLATCNKKPFLFELARVDSIIYESKNSDWYRHIIWIDWCYENNDFIKADQWWNEYASESEKWKWSRSVVSDPQRPHGLQPSRLLHPWGFPGKSTGVGCHCLLWVRSLAVLNHDGAVTWWGKASRFG